MNGRMDSKEKKENFLLSKLTAKNDNHFFKNADIRAFKN